MRARRGRRGGSSRRSAGSAARRGRDLAGEGGDRRPRELGGRQPAGPGRGTRAIRGRGRSPGGDGAIDADLEATMNDRMPRLSDELPVEAEAHLAECPREPAPGGAGRIRLRRRKEPHPLQQRPLRAGEQDPPVPSGVSGREMNQAHDEASRGGAETVRASPSHGRRRIAQRDRPSTSGRRAVQICWPRSMRAAVTSPGIPLRQEEPRRGGAGARYAPASPLRPRRRRVARLTRVTLASRAGTRSPNASDATAADM